MAEKFDLDLRLMKIFMKMISRAAFMTLAAVSLLSCGGNSSSPAVPATPVEVKESYEAEGVAFEMKEVSGGTYAMWTKAGSRLVSGATAPHQVVFDGYAISSQPVSQRLWTAVMGDNPSSTVGENLPVDKVSYDDCQKFLKKLRKMTGVDFVLPTEAQLEYAFNNSAVSYVKPTREWCADFWSDSAPEGLTINPTGPSEGDKYVVRTDSKREPLAGYTKAGGLTFRLAFPTGKPVDQAIVKVFVDQVVDRENVCSDETIEVNGTKIVMKAVKGGTFQMGATPEQGEYAKDNEKPVHEVTVADFEMAQTEVTAGLWQAVMGEMPLGNDEKELEKPVINVSWYAAQEFIMKLNSLTGRKFRLPTEAEWEYAARGGQKSGNYRYSGSNEASSVAAYNKNTANGKVVKVKSYRPNELGLYDMSGNVWEWCQDCWYEYGKPVEKSEWHINRGGSSASQWVACRVSNRQRIPASNMKGTFGLRLAL